MRKIVIFLVAIATTGIATGQMQFAVLDHAGSLSAYYGTGALEQAHAAAAAGDIITLSSGTFNMDDKTISKAVTIRGAGFETDTVANTLYTRIDGTLTAEIARDTLHRLKLEGLYFSGTFRPKTLYNPMINKCQFNTISNSSSYTLQGATFVNCIISNMGFHTNFTDNQFVNCIILSSASSAPGGNNTFANCYVVHAAQENDWWSNFNISNSILYNDYNSSSYPRATALVDPIYNCIGITRRNTMFSSQTASHHLYNVSNTTTLFKAGTRYELLDSLASIYVGSDGTQIGPAGGAFPFKSSSVRHPKLGRITPALQTNSEGKLEVDVEVISE